MSSAKQKTKHQKLPEAVRRAAILEAAHKLFNKSGYQKTRMDDVAALAGLTKGGLYFHFKDKRALYEAVMLDCIERIDKIKTETSSLDLEPEEMLSAYMYAMFQEMMGDFEGQEIDGYPGAMELFMEGHRLMFTRGEIGGLYERLRSFISGIIQRGIDSGLFAETVDPELSSVVAVSMWVGMYLQCASDPKAFDLEKIAVNFHDQFLNGLRRKA